ncbi:MAG TPA: ATP-binding protein [Pyrinomonadaceae bacterium]|nr:ATP-binding protein [Pyrinomonadaceae bacterium]
MAKKMAKDKKPQPPLLYTKGWKEEKAVYKEQVIPEYGGHPLIEALPPIWSEEEVIERLSYFPRFSEAERDLPSEIRLHIIENSRELFVVQGIHLAIEVKISRMLRRGLIRRNPSQWHYWTELDSRIAEITRSLEKGMFLQTKARGCAVIGIGGVGKSTAVENVFLQYPQVITHTKYRNTDFIFNHLVWLKLDCPQDGSARSLCVNFFRAVDEILGTDYETRYVRERSSASTLLPQMARVAALHCIGVLAIDEVQNLSEAASGGASQLINFLVQLENTIGVPVILIATDEAQHIFCGKFHHARRLSEQGDVIWNPMEERVRKTESEIEEDRKANPSGTVELWKPDPVWEEFVRALWDYQYVRKPTPLKDNLLEDELSRTLHKYSFGITALASAIYMLAQERAIRTRRETITKQIIESVGQDSLGLIQEFTERHRLRGTHKIFRRAAQARNTGGSNAAKLAADNRPAEVGSSSGNATEPQPDNKKGRQNAPPASPGKGRSRARKPSPVIKDAEDIRGLEAAISAGTPTHEAFKNAGHIRASNEFLKGATME